MTTIRLQMSELGPAFQRLGPRLPVAARRGALRGAYRAVLTLQRATGHAPPANPNMIGVGGAVNTAHYKRSWKGEQLSDGARVFNDAPYAAVIEHGRRVGTFPPLRVIALWAQRRMGLSAKEAKAAAYPIARAIARRGLMGRKVMTNSQAQIKQDFLEEVLKELGREMTRAP